MLVGSWSFFPAPCTANLIAWAWHQLLYCVACVVLLFLLLPQVTDASGSSLASHCASLAAVKLTKAMTDSTIKQLAQSCPLLQEADLHRWEGRMGDTPAVSDGGGCGSDYCGVQNAYSIGIMQTHVGVQLQELRQFGHVTPQTLCVVLLALLCRCTRVSCAALLQLLQGCQQLHKLVLPLQLDVTPLLEGRSHSLEEDEEQERQVLLLHQQP